MTAIRNNSDYMEYLPQFYRYIFKHRGIWKSAKEAIREKRLQAGEEEWQKQIAALTIQLCWRKFYRWERLDNIYHLVRIV